MFLQLLNLSVVQWGLSSWDVSVKRTMLRVEGTVSNKIQVVTQFSYWRVFHLKSMMKCHKKKNPAVQLRENSEIKDRAPFFIIPRFYFSTCPQTHCKVIVSVWCFARWWAITSVTGFSWKYNRRQWTKEYLRGRSSYLGKRESTCAGSQRCQRQIDSLCSLSAIVRPCLCVCLSVATFSHLTCTDSFPSLLFSPSSLDSCVFSMSCFLSLFARDAHTLLIFRRLCSPPLSCFSVMLTDTLLKWWFSARSWVKWLCAAVCDSSHAWDRLETASNGCESHAL